MSETMMTPINSTLNVNCNNAVVSLLPTTRNEKMKFLMVNVAVLVAAGVLIGLSATRKVPSLSGLVRGRRLHCAVAAMIGVTVLAAPILDMRLPFSVVVVGMVLESAMVLVEMHTKNRLLSTYETIASLLSGMNRRQIDWVAAQTMATTQSDFDAVRLAFKALLLHPGVFQSSLLHKDESESILAWKRAEELGLSSEAASGNPFALWLQGMLVGLFHQDVDTAMYLFQLSANSGFALAQNSLGVIYQGLGQLAIAMEYYMLAAAQGVADA